MDPDDDASLARSAYPRGAATTERQTANPNLAPLLPGVVSRHGVCAEEWLEPRKRGRFECFHRGESGPNEEHKLPVDAIAREYVRIARVGLEGSDNTSVVEHAHVGQHAPIRRPRLLMDCYRFDTIRVPDA